MNNIVRIAKMMRSSHNGAPVSGITGESGKVENLMYNMKEIIYR